MAALIAVQVLFGAGYVVSKVVITAFPPLVWASIRIIVSSMIMLAFALASKRKHPTDGAKFFKPLIGYALLGMIINQSSFLLGLSYTTSTNSAILNTLIPVFTLLIVTIRGQEPATSKRIIGFLLSFTGVLVIRHVENFSFSDKTLIGDLLTMLNCFSYALFLSYSKKFLEQHDRVWTTTWLFIYGSFGLTLVAMPSYMSFHWPVMTPTLWACVAFAIVGTTLMTYFLNNWTLARTKSSHVALFIYLQPIIAAFIAWIWFGEVITLRTALSSILIFLGVVLAMARR